MPLINYSGKTLKGDRLVAAVRARDICNEYARAGYDLTLRQLYYQFVARGLIANSDRSYKWLGSVVNDARHAGVIDWDHIEDRTRALEALPHWENPAEIIDVVARQFRVDLWTDQPRRVEVWVEKEALAGVVERAAQRLDVPYFSCRGYASASSMWEAAQRIGAYTTAGQAVTILHLGDHDPSGVDMSRDIRDRLTEFITDDVYREHFTPAMRQQVETEDGDGWYPGRVPGVWQDEHGVDPVPEVRRIALTMAQVEEWDPPPNPAKVTDSRAASYINLYGHESWELDALDPATLDELITGHIEGCIEDRERFDERIDERDEGRAQLRQVSDQWADIVAAL